MALWHIGEGKGYSLQPSLPQRFRPCILCIRWRPGGRPGGRRKDNRPMGRVLPGVARRTRKCTHLPDRRSRVLEQRHNRLLCRCDVRPERRAQARRQTGDRAQSRKLQSPRRLRQPGMVGIPAGMRTKGPQPGTWQKHTANNRRGSHAAKLQWNGVTCCLATDSVASDLSSSGTTRESNAAHSRLDSSPCKTCATPDSTVGTD